MIHSAWVWLLGGVIVGAVIAWAVAYSVLAIERAMDDGESGK